ncbi:MAG: HAD-IIIC family phosphatase [Lachnospiraceae bacterium]|nr:HAD-IIIC family phosphatase [Lachnospiraceae bacterium]
MEKLREMSTTKLLRLADRLQKDPETYSMATGSAKKVRIAVLGSYSIQHFVKVLKLYMDRTGLIAEVYEGEYGGINMDVLDESSPLYSFGADFVLILSRYNDFSLESEDDLNNAKSWYESLWGHLGRIPGATVICSNIATPLERTFGSLSASSTDSPLYLYRKLNLFLTETHPSNVRILDMDYLSGFFGKEYWFDERNYYLTKQGASLDFLGPIADEVTKMILPVLGKVHKCLVLDLDNTLWGGVVGDDGPDGIDIDPHDPLGEAYRAFQSYVLSLKKRGVILAVNSKNDEAIAKEPFEKNSDMILKLSDIACFVANWQDKASNMAFIAKSLNIGIDSLVFFDDNPAERDIVRKFCPEALVVEVPEEPEEYIRALDCSGAFDWAEITEEDRARSDSYAQNAKREELAASFVDYREYLKALEMKGTAAPVGEKELQRFAQLTNKSNQFNLRTRRYTEGELRGMLLESRYRLIYVSLSDRFTQYGIISCIILKQGSAAEGFSEEDCFIDNWCMSCRVLKRSVELFAFREVVKEAREMGCKRLIGEYIRTKKNGMVEGLYPKLGFTALESEDRVLYAYDLSKEIEGEIWIGNEH